MADQSKYSRGNESPNPNPEPSVECDYARVLIPDENNIEIPQAESRSPLNHFIDFVFLFVATTLFILVSSNWVLPFLNNKIILPIVDWEKQTFTRHSLSSILISSLSLFPLFLIPSGPSMFLTGLFFGLDIGYFIVIIGTTIGIIPPFLFARKFPELINKLLGPPENKIRELGERDFSYQFNMVALIRLSSFPYSIFNYTAGLTSVKFMPYLWGSVFVMIPESFYYLFSARAVRVSAEIMSGRYLITRPDAVFHVVITVLAFVLCLQFKYCQQLANRYKDYQGL